MKFTKFHYNLKDWAESLQFQMNRCCELLSKYPDDPRYENTMKQLTIYQTFYNIMSGSDDTAMSQEVWEYMVKCFKESTEIGKFKKVEVEDVTLPLYANAPELVEMDTEHAQEMEALDVPKKKTKKVKSK